MNYVDKLIETLVEAYETLDVTDQVVYDGGINTELLLDILATRPVVQVAKAVASPILQKIGYEKDSLPLRFQKIINSTAQEAALYSGLLNQNTLVKVDKLSRGFFNGRPESGTDFMIETDKAIISLDAKVFYNEESMLTTAADADNKFHGADLICSYLLVGNPKWRWLYKQKDGAYRDLGRAPTFIVKPLPFFMTYSCTDRGDFYEIRPRIS